MGGGVAGWLTPGWTIDEPRLHPHLHTKINVSQMLKDGEDPKALLLEECKPQCKFYKDKLTRCEAALESIIKVNPTKTCLYAMRDYVTCTEACVQPIIHNKLVGAGHD